MTQQIDTTKRHTLRGEEAAAFWDKVLEEGIKPHVQAIARAHLDGDIAVIFHDVSTAKDGPMGAATEEAARSLGWTGKDGASRLSRTRANKIADNIERSHPGDKAGVAWLRSRKPGRVFVLMHAANLMVNFEPGRGWYMEPGTMDQEWHS